MPLTRNPEGAKPWVRSDLDHRAPNAPLGFIGFKMHPFPIRLANVEVALPLNPLSLPGFLAIGTRYEGLLLRIPQP